VSDIFISYASADRERAKLFAEVLAEQGWSVWWDRAIPPGRQFDEVIEEALDAAKCVVVLWSQASAASTWVKTEAAEAMRRKALIPAIIEEVRIPLEFRRLQAADLSHWTGDRADPQLAQFFQSIATELQRSAAPDAVSQPAAAPAIEPRSQPAAVPHASAAVQTASQHAPPARKRSPAVVAIAVAIVALLGGLMYYERSRSIAAAEEAARTKALQEQAERDRQSAARENAARASKVESERTARQQAPAARPNAPSQSAAPAAVPPSGVLNLQWRDHALGYRGNLSWNPGSAMFRVSVVDLQSGTALGNFAVPAMISQQGASEYVVSGQFAVSGDSMTPGPHTHTSRLILRAQQDGSLRFLQNCPKPGECY
jgi:hypothetical protein